MALIEIYNKTAADADFTHLLEQTYAMKTPLGVPTVFIRDGFSETQKGGKGTLPLLLSVVAKHLQDFSSTPLFAAMPPEVQEEIQSLTERQPFINDMRAISESLPLPWSYGLGGETPALSIVYSPKSEGLGVNLARKIGMPVSAAPKLPGTSEETEFLDAWHEIAKGLGATEPQAEMIAAIMGRRASMDNAVLQARADVNAASAVFNFGEMHNSKALEYYNDVYGWPMVDAVDCVLAMPEEGVFSMMEDQITAIKTRKIKHLESTLYGVIYAISAKDEHAFDSKDIEALAVIAGQFARDGYFPRKRENDMSARLALAFSRIHQGETAYKQDYALPEKYKFHSLKVKGEPDVFSAPD